MTCDHCRYLQQENQRLSEENKYLKGKLNAIYLACQAIYQYSVDKMSEGGLPRGTWSLLKGGGAVALKIMRIAG